MYLSKWVLQSNRKLKVSHVRLQTDFPSIAAYILFILFTLTADRPFAGLVGEQCRENHYDLVKWMSFYTCMFLQTPVVNLTQIKGHKNINTKHNTTVFVHCSYVSCHQPWTKNWLWISKVVVKMIQRVSRNWWKPHVINSLQILLVIHCLFMQYKKISLLSGVGQM